MKPTLSIVLPCLNEEKAVRHCLDSISRLVKEKQIPAETEVVIVDNNSTDASASLVREYQMSKPPFELVLTEEKIPGYGSAYQKGFSLARGKYVFMADLDGTYDFADIPHFIRKLDEGYDLVMGNRFSHTDATGAAKLGSMPWHHRYIGNPFLSGLVRLFFGVKVRDIHCGARLITKKSLDRLSLTTRGMEFASEMIIKAARANIPMAEIAIRYDNRIGTSKLQSFRDGWRHTRFIFLYSPIVLFLIPGLTLFIIGVISMVVLYFTSPTFLNLRFYVHPMFFSAGCIIAGYQLIYFAFFAKTYAMLHMGEKNAFFESLFEYITLDRACIAGSIIFIVGIALYVYVAYRWIHSGFGQLDEIKNSIAALTLLVVGVQTISSAFMMSIISIKEK